MSDRGVTRVDTDYLRRANGHLRKSIIAFACVNEVMALPVAAGECFGRPLSHWLGLDAASAVVHEILWQDRSMAAWAARDCLVTLDALLHGMDSSWGDAVETAMTAAGLRTGPVIAPDEVDNLSPSTRDDVLRLANRVLSMFFAFERSDGSGRVDRAFYQRLFAARSMSAALVAHDIAAWAAVVIGRLVHAGYLDEMLWMSPDFSTVPVMTAPGWHPNPFQMGEIVDGEAGWQRYWDGTDWTDQVRQRGPGGWHVLTRTMFEAPPN
jgi:hypothetical protein